MKLFAAQGVMLEVDPTETHGSLYYRKTDVYNALLEREKAIRARDDEINRLATLLKSMEKTDDDDGLAATSDSGE